MPTYTLIQLIDKSKLYIKNSHTKKAPVNEKISKKKLQNIKEPAKALERQMNDSNKQLQKILKVKFIKTAPQSVFEYIIKDFNK